MCCGGGLIWYSREIGLCPPCTWDTPHIWGDPISAVEKRRKAGGSLPPFFHRWNGIISHFSGGKTAETLPPRFRRFSTAEMGSPHIWGVSHVHGGQRPISQEYQINPLPQHIWYSSNWNDHHPIPSSSIFCLKNRSRSKFCLKNRSRRQKHFFQLCFHGQSCL